MDIRQAAPAIHALWTCLNPDHDVVQFAQTSEVHPRIRSIRSRLCAPVSLDVAPKEERESCQVDDMAEAPNTVLRRIPQNPMLLQPGIHPPKHRGHVAGVVRDGKPKALKAAKGVSKLQHHLSQVIAGVCTECATQTEQNRPQDPVRVDKLASYTEECPVIKKDPAVRD